MILYICKMKGEKKFMEFTVFRGDYPNFIEEVVLEFEAPGLYEALLRLEEEEYSVKYICSMNLDGYTYVDFGEWDYFLSYKQIQ